MSANWNQDFCLGVSKSDSSAYHCNNNCYPSSPVRSSSDSPVSFPGQPLLDVNSNQNVEWSALEYNQFIIATSRQETGYMSPTSSIEDTQDWASQVSPASNVCSSSPAAYVSQGSPATNQVNFTFDMVSPNCHTNYEASLLDVDFKFPSQADLDASLPKVYPSLPDYQTVLSVSQNEEVPQKKRSVSSVPCNLSKPNKPSRKLVTKATKRAAANARERKRMCGLNAGFQRLISLIQKDEFKRDKPMSKIEALRSARSRILELKQALGSLDMS